MPSRPIGLDMHVTTADDIIIDNNYLEAEIAGDLQIAGTLERPTVTGRVAVSDGGRVRFGNRVYEIDTAVVDLVDPTGIEPELTLTARTQAGSYEVTLEANGGRDDLTTELRSEPPLPVRRQGAHRTVRRQCPGRHPGQPGAMAGGNALLILNQEIRVRA